MASQHDSSKINISHRGSPINRHNYSPSEQEMPSLLFMHWSQQWFHLGHTSLSWDMSLLYTYPLWWSWFPKVIFKLKQEQSRLILFAPAWARQLCFLNLCGFFVRESLPTFSHGLNIQYQRQILHQKLQLLLLKLWFLNPREALCSEAIQNVLFNGRKPSIRST